MKQLTAILLAMFMIATPLGVFFGVATSAEVTPVTPLFAGGDGTPGNPYQISNVTELQWMGNLSNLDKHFILVADINASETSGWDGGQGFAPIGSDVTLFTGSFNGNGYVISNLHIDRSAADYIGLFGYTNTGTEVKNVGLVDGNITGHNIVGGLVGANRGFVNDSFFKGTLVLNNQGGGLVGWNYDGMVSGSYSEGTVTAASFTAGGLIGFNEPGVVNNSHSAANVTGTDQVGGLVGYGSQGLLNNSYATGTANGEIYVGGLAGFVQDFTISNCYASGAVRGLSSLGGLAGWTDYGTVSNCYATGTVTRSAGAAIPVGGFVGYNWDGKILNSYSTGRVIFEGAADPNDKGFCGAVNTGVGYEMTGNFWDTETSLQVTTAGGAAGQNIAEMMNNFTFNNAGWDFSNIWFSVNASTRPFLRMEWSQEIRNSHQLQLMQMDLAADYTLMNNIQLSDITIPSLMWGSNLTSGGGFWPVGNDTDTFQGSLDGGGHTISGLFINRSAGEYNGLFGMTDIGAFIENLILTDIYLAGFYWTGGIAGYNNGNIANCSSVGTVSTTDDWAGLLVGSNTGVIMNCTSSGNTSGKSQIGGLAGENDFGTITNCSSSGQVTGEYDTGGFVGYNGGEITNSSTTANVTGTGTGNGIGGFVGYNYDPITNCSSSGNVVATSWYVGGFIGSNSGPVVGCTSNGSASGTSDVGGFVGYNEDSIGNCSSTGDAVGTGGNVGGFAGWNGAFISNCHAWGDASGGGSNVGGFAGENDAATIKHCYSIGNASGALPVGGFCGLDTGGSFVYCFWDIETSGRTTSDGGAGRTTAQMKTESTFTGWDFAHIWNITETVTYPVLRWGGPAKTMSGNGTASNPFIITNVWELQDMALNLTANYVLGNNIDAIATRDWNWNVGNSIFEGFQPVGYLGPTTSQPFSGSFDGRGYSITDLYINRPNADNIGLFSFGYWSPISNVSMLDVNISGRMRVGSVAGDFEQSNMVNCHVTGHVYGMIILGDSYVGGLVGQNHGAIHDCHVNVSVFSLGGNQIGGLVGRGGGEWPRPSGIVANCTAAGTINGEHRIGGLMGENWGKIENSSFQGYVEGNFETGGFVGYQNGADGKIQYCQAVGTVLGWGDNVGGFIGRNQWAPVTSSFAHVNVTGRSWGLGGFAGLNHDGGTISDCYSTGNVTDSKVADRRSAAFAGSNDQAKIINCYSTGSVFYDGFPDPADMGFCGYIATGGSYEMTGDFWDADVSNQATNSLGNATGLNTTRMQTLSTFRAAGWDIVRIRDLTDEIWYIEDHYDYPRLNREPFTDTRAPVADAGPDMLENLGNVTVFDSSACLDNYDISNYTWTFTDGVAVTLYGAAPTHTFGSLGFYTVTLTVSDAVGFTDTDTMTVTVEDLEAPAANAGPDQIVDEDTPVTFNGTASTDNLDVATYTWTFAVPMHAITLNGEQPTYTFATPGFYTVTLNVTDAAGHWATDTMTVMVNDITDPLANAGPDQTVTVGSVVTFTGAGSSDNVGISDFAWNFTFGGTERTLSGVSPTFNFTAAGNYTVTLTVRDAAGNTGTDMMSVTVIATADTTAPVADAGADQSVAAGTAVTFNGDGSTDDTGIAGYVWTFTYNGTALTHYGISTTFTFWTPGNYTVTLNVTDASGNWDTDTMLVIVTAAAPHADDDTGGGMLGGTAVIILFVAVVAIIAAAMFLLKKKGGKPQEPDGSEGGDGEDGDEDEDVSSDEVPQETETAQPESQ